MSGDEPKRRSSSRRIARPRVPPGPLRELKELLYRLYLSAGPPTLDDVAAEIAKDDDLPGAPARDTIARILGHPELPANQPDAVAVATVLARAARWDPADAAVRVRQLWVEAELVEPVGRPLQDVTDPLALEIHEPITVTGSSGLPVLPYLEREHDRELRERIGEAVAERRSTIVVLVGGSSTGKTRACWEAIHADAAGEKLLAGWRVWHPYDPGRPEAALAALERVGPRTVVWLNETQFYLLTTGSDQGERVAARLRAVLADDGRAPVAHDPAHAPSPPTRSPAWSPGPALAPGCPTASPGTGCAAGSPPPPTAPAGTPWTSPGTAAGRTTPPNSSATSTEKSAGTGPATGWTSTPRRRPTERGNTSGTRPAPVRSSPTPSPGSPPLPTGPAGTC
jgi:hypothetical protein